MVLTTQTIRHVRVWGKLRDCQCPRHFRFVSKRYRFAALRQLTFRAQKETFPGRSEHPKLGHRTRRGGVMSFRAFLICINELRSRAAENSKFNRGERTA